MSRYKDHRKPRRHRDDDEPFSFPEKSIVPSFFQRPPPTVAAPVDAQVKWFNASRGFGFVKASDGTEAYLPLRVLEAIGSHGVAEGAHLKVTLEETKKGHQVAQVLEIGEETPKSSGNTPAGGTAIVRSQAQFATRGTVKGDVTLSAYTRVETCGR
ncbi:MAG: cold shock domain-containing protein [Mesorhizobium sp.]|uniref:cold-shock protein n=1 Tax=Mesorhizobium sp. TaxID=1871066 RepID=UPI0012024C82|nr:cold shock domain-containing protein [Mesorhizobium sp.]TIL20439.1 MAG: cold shock domain-containing protein [Mesorhizobium sp.]